MPLAEEIAGLSARRQAQVSVWMGGSDGLTWFAREAEVPHVAASTFKLALVVALHAEAERGVADLTEEIPVRATLPSTDGREYTTTQDYDNDDAVWRHLGGTASLGWLAERAIVRSSNLATNLLIDRLGTEAVNAVYDAAGAIGCRLRNGIQQPGPGNNVSAHGLALTLAALDRGALLGPCGTAHVLSLLACCEDQMAAAGLPAGTPFAHKPGWLEGVAHDHGLVRPVGEKPFALAILTGSHLDDPDAARLVAEVAALCWAHRHDVAR